jgi:ribosome modulation factor
MPVDRSMSTRLPAAATVSLPTRQARQSTVELERGLEVGMDGRSGPQLVQHHARRTALIADQQVTEHVEAIDTREVVEAHGIQDQHSRQSRIAHGSISGLAGRSSIAICPCMSSTARSEVTKSSRHACITACA